MRRRMPKKASRNAKFGIRSVNGRLISVDLVSESAMICNDDIINKKKKILCTLHEKGLSNKDIYVIATDILESDIKYTKRNMVRNIDILDLKEISKFVESINGKPWFYPKMLSDDTIRIVSKLSQNIK